MKLFRFTLCVLALLAGSLTTGATSSEAAVASITLSPNSGPAGATVKVTGTGFSKKTAGTVKAGTESAAFTAGASGFFTVDVVIPAAAGPTLPVQAVAGASKAAAQFTYTTISAAQPAPAPEEPPAAPLRFGVGTPGGPLATAELDEVTALVNEAPSIILSYKDFHQPPPLEELDAARARGAEVLLTWEPWTWGGGTAQPAYSLDRITAGDFDPYLRQWGQALAGWGHPVMLRFGHEMNGSWYPWSEQLNGNGPGTFVAAWRHVHDVVTSTGALNITWIWNPNVPYSGSAELGALYPGSSYVDAVALDGYNWGSSTTSNWVFPSQLFGEGLAQLRSLAPGKQILVAETSSAEQGGSKAEWNTALISYLASQRDVTAVIWFNFNKETDWRINSSAASAGALKAALASRPR